MGTTAAVEAASVEADSPEAGFPEAVFTEAEAPVGGIIFRRAAFSSMYGPSIRFRDPSAEKLCVQQVMRYSPALRDIHIRVCFAVARYTKKRTRSLNTFRTTFRCLPLSF